jgi:hypothetical protein
MERQEALNAANRDLALFAVENFGESSDMLASFVGTRQDLQRAQRCSLRPVIIMNAVPAARFAEVFAQQLPSAGIQQAYALQVPLHLHTATDPARWRTEGVVIFSVVDLDMPLPLALVWRRDNTSPLLANFIAEVQSLADVRAVKKRYRPS